MQNRILARSLLLFIITTCFALALQSTEPKKSSQSRNSYQDDYYRDRRHTVKKHPGFFRTLFSVLHEQWADTKGTFQKVNQLINDNFLPEDGDHFTQTTTVSSDPNATTTEAPFKITRTEFNRILRRNLRGLARLFSIELNDALSATHHNEEHYRKNASKEVSKFL